MAGDDSSAAGGGNDGAVAAADGADAEHPPAESTSLFVRWAEESLGVAVHMTGAPEWRGVDELAQPPPTCAAQVCLCPRGPAFDAAGCNLRRAQAPSLQLHWTLLVCGACGHHAAHQRCTLPADTPDDPERHYAGVGRWHCAICAPALPVALRSSLEAAHARVPIPHLFSQRARDDELRAASLRAPEGGSLQDEAATSEGRASTVSDTSLSARNAADGDDLSATFEAVGALARPGVRDARAHTANDGPRHCAEIVAAFARDERDALAAAGVPARLAHALRRAPYVRRGGGGRRVRRRRRHRLGCAHSRRAHSAHLACSAT